MISDTEKVGSTGESPQTSIEKHPLEDMPSFEDHVYQIESSETETLSKER